MTKNIQYSKLEYFYLKNGFVEVKEFTLVEFCESGFFKHTICQNKEMRMNNFQMIALIDLIRFAVLDKYAGRYIF